MKKQILFCFLIGSCLSSLAADPGTRVKTFLQWLFTKKNVAQEGEAAPVQHDAQQDAQQKNSVTTQAADDTKSTSAISTSPESTTAPAAATMPDTTTASAPTALAENAALVETTALTDRAQNGEEKKSVPAYVTRILRTLSEEEAEKVVAQLWEGAVPANEKQQFLERLETLSYQEGGAQKILRATRSTVKNQYKRLARQWGGSLDEPLAQKLLPLLHEVYLRAVANPDK